MVMVMVQLSPWGRVAVGTATSHIHRNGGPVQDQPKHAETWSACRRPIKEPPVPHKEQHGSNRTSRAVQANEDNCTTGRAQGGGHRVMSSDMEAHKEAHTGAAALHLTVQRVLIAYRPSNHTSSRPSEEIRPSNHMSEHARAYDCLDLCTHLVNKIEELTCDQNLKSFALPRSFKIHILRNSVQMEATWTSDIAALVDLQRAPAMQYSCPFVRLSVSIST